MIDFPRMCGGGRGVSANLDDEARGEPFHLWIQLQRLRPARPPGKGPPSLLLRHWEEFGEAPRGERRGEEAAEGGVLLAVLMEDILGSESLDRGHGDGYTSVSGPGHLKEVPHGVVFGTRKRTFLGVSAYLRKASGQDDLKIPLAS